MAAKQLKGTYNLNPTSQVMKQGSRLEREQLSGGRGKEPKGTRVAEAHEVPADNEGVESKLHHPAHPAMQTRHSHPRNTKHADGRGHEDDHHAVRKMKGM